ncbi:LacI family DNA-binding transcriptional regulator [Streptococcus gallolyticus]|uniref:LacI family DNA-binding transcriptional regulator n=1 Tax=Streptococcus hepaticus TaxID=3349163 RepID=UPI001C94B355|nr:LacI family DNA-binding transcriptional regulator [Streptococcus gallolyticus]MBY5041748.1 LacI family DNA-binding transcriptional regulator [Streptococcus gallolyticus]
MVTMKDVAQLAGVGVGTVSRVINNGSVKEVTKAKVLAAIEELNYEPDSYARGMKLQKTNVVALIIPTVWHPFYGEFAYYVENELAHNGYKCMLCNSDSNSERELEYIKMMQQNKVDGIIGITYSDIDPYISSNLPFVSIDRHFSDDVVSVSADNEQAGRLAAKTLMAKGCKSLAYIGGKPKYPTEIGKRQMYFTKTCEEAGVENTYLLMPEPIQHFDKQVQKFITENPSIDGLFVINDFMALDVMKILVKMGKRVPEDIQVIGCDGIKMANERDNVVSTIRQPVDQMAIKSVDSLLKMINGETFERFSVLSVSYQEGNTTK